MSSLTPEQEKMQRMKEHFGALKTEDLQALAKQLTALEKDSEPKNDDQLHAWIVKNLGINLPRNACCDNHTTPFAFIADIYFERTTNAIALAARESFKTAGSAVIHLLNSLYKPGCQSVSVGAIEAQSLRAYETLRSFLKSHGDVVDEEAHPMVDKVNSRKVTFRNDSWLELLPSTMTAVNGGHPQKVHADEMELMDRSVFKESRNMSSSRTIIDKKTGKERLIKAQDWITSTRKWAKGPMQELINEIIEAKAIGKKPPYDLYEWCIFDVSRNVPNCRVANPDLPEEEKCQCQEIVKGSWDDETPRSFDQVCNGKLSKAEGFLRLEDVQKKFLQNDQETWEAQLECSKPETGGMVFPMFTKDRHGIKWYEPHPDNGTIYMGVDWGGTNPHAVTWYQILSEDMTLYGKNDEQGKPTKLVKAGTRVVFDEIYVANISPSQLGEAVIAKETSFKKLYNAFKVEKRFCDPAGKSSRLEWASMKPIPIPTVFFCTRDIKEQIRTCKDLMRDDLIVFDLIKTEKLIDEIESYHYPQKKPGMIDDPELPVDDYNHAVSSMRYAVEHLKILEVGNHQGRGLPRAGNQTHKIKNPAKSSAPRYLPREYGV